MHLVDTHQHLWDLRRFPYSWCAGIPALNRSFLLSDYVAALDASASAPLAARPAVTKTVFMECDVDEPHGLAEAQHIQTLSDSLAETSGHPLIHGIVATGRPERDGFRAHLEQLSRLPKLRGLRRILHTQPDELSQQPRFVENLRLLPEFGLTFDLCVLARQLPLARALIAQLPEVTFILDHCGAPDVKGRAFDPWREDLRAIAALPNVSCKISGIVAYAAPDWTTADLQRWFDHVITCFGWDRVVWGGDWPVCLLGAPLARWIDTTAALATSAGATDIQRAKLYHLNAERLYRV